MERPTDCRTPQTAMVRLRPAPDGSYNRAMPTPSRNVAASPPATEWYADGLRFECTQCGNCCTGPAGYVWFTPEEGRAMAGALGIDLNVFLKRYARTVGGHDSLREYKTDHGHDCVFLDRTSRPGKAICSIYKTRPKQCRTWPFWPENLKSKRAWQIVKRTTPCPGIGQGRVIPIEAIRIDRDQTPRDPDE